VRRALSSVRFYDAFLNNLVALDFCNTSFRYEAARAAAFMGYKIICSLQGLAVVKDASGDITRFTDPLYNGYLANMSPSIFARKFERALPEQMTGRDFTEQYGFHADPATQVLPDHVYSVRANTKYAVMENNRVTLFYNLIKGCPSAGGGAELYSQLGELMCAPPPPPPTPLPPNTFLRYQSHDAYTECGLGSSATSAIVDLVRALPPDCGLFGAKITGGGAGGTVVVLGLRSAADAFHRCVVMPYAALRGLSQPPTVFAGSSQGADGFGTRQLSAE
jgi:galactokinase